MTTITYPERKLQRLKNYDYSTNGAYFITQCTQDKKYLLGRISDGNMKLNIAGKDVENILLKLSEKYNDMLYKYIIMPNHIHFLFLLDRKENISIETFMQQLKSITTVNYINNVKEGLLPPFEKRIWQKSYNDRIIRNETDFLIHWQYIENNPYAWDTDEYFML